MVRPLQINPLAITMEIGVRRGSWKNRAINGEADPIKSVEELMAHLERSDLVVSPRFHNVVLGLLLGKPVMAMAYHEKFAALLDSPELAPLNVAIERLDLGTVTSAFETLEAQREALSRHVRDKVERHRAALDEQYELIFRNGRGQSTGLGAVR